MLTKCALDLPSALALALFFSILGIFLFFCTVFDVVYTAQKCLAQQSKRRGGRRSCKNNLWRASTTLRAGAAMIDGVPECLPWPGNHGRWPMAKARRGEVNPKPKICCGRYISRTHCHRDAAVESASEERQLERDGERERER